MTIPTDGYRTVPEATYRAIAAEIASDDSPVGIDAKKTHIIILHQLARIEQRLARIEEVLDVDP